MHDHGGTGIARTVGEGVREAVGLRIVDGCERPNLARARRQARLDAGQESGLVGAKLHAVDVRPELRGTVLHHQKLHRRKVLGEIRHHVDEFGSRRDDEGRAIVDRRAEVFAAGFGITALEDAHLRADGVAAIEHALAGHVQIHVHAERQRRNQDYLFRSGCGACGEDAEGDEGP